MINADGVAGAVVGGSFLGPDFGSAFALSATDVSVTFNNTTNAYTDIAGTGIDIVAAPADGQFLTFVLVDPNLRLAGTAVSAASVTVELVVDPAGDTVSISVDDLVLTLGDGAATPVLEFFADDAVLVVDGEGVFADVSGLTVQTNNTGLTFGGSFDLTVDTRTPSNRYVRATLEGGTLSVGSQSISGDFFFEQVRTSPSRTVVKVGASNVSVVMGNPTTRSSG